MFLDSKLNPIQEDDIVTCIDPYSKKELFGRAIYKSVREGKSYWFVYLPLSHGRKLVFLTAKYASTCEVVGNYHDKPAEWEFLLKGNLAEPKK